MGTFTAMAGNLICLFQFIVKVRNQYILPGDAIPIVAGTGRSH